MRQVVRIEAGRIGAKGEGGGPGRGLAPLRQAMNDHPESAEATYRPPAFELLKTAHDVFNLPQPAPVLWRDPGPGTDSSGDVDAVLSVGEVAILASAGGLGKSCLTLALAVEAPSSRCRTRTLRPGSAPACAGSRLPPGAVLPMGKPGPSFRLDDVSETSGQRTLHKAQPGL